MCNLAMLHSYLISFLKRSAICTRAAPVVALQFPTKLARFNITRRAFSSVPRLGLPGRDHFAGS